MVSDSLKKTLKSAAWFRIPSRRPPHLLAKLVGE